MVYQAAIMNKNFMIGFMYQGYFYCANVHRIQLTPLEYEVVILSNRVNDGLPDKIVIRNVGDRYVQAWGRSVQPALLKTILAEIEKHVTLS